MNKKYKMLIFILASLVILPLIVNSCAQPHVNTEKGNVQPSVNMENLEKTYTSPGLVEQSGSEHLISEPNNKVEKTIDVTKSPYNAVPNDGKDDTDAIQNAINDAAKIPGTKVYLPRGTYNLSNPTTKSSFLQLKSGVNLTGESKDTVILIADADKISGSTGIIEGMGVESILISNFQVTSVKTSNGKYSTDTEKPNPNAFGAQYNIWIGANSKVASKNVVIENVGVENFKRGGIRIEKSHDTIVRKCSFSNATAVDGGGAGYGVVIQGTVKDSEQLGRYDDTYFNLVENCNFTGPYIRHGVLLQFYAHNNLVRNNSFDGTLLDSVDLHGENEFLNEICDNNIKDVTKGGAIGVGNTGGIAPSNHSSSGPSNYIHDNVIENCRDGISVIMGSPKTRIENNIIKNTSINNSKGIMLKNAPDTIVKNNIIENNMEKGFISIYITKDEGDKSANNLGAGEPKDDLIDGNKIRNNSNGIIVEAGNKISIFNNSINDNLASTFTAIAIKDGNYISIKDNTLNNNTKGVSITGGEDIVNSNCP